MTSCKNCNTHYDGRAYIMCPRCNDVVFAYRSSAMRALVRLERDEYIRAVTEMQGDIK